MKKENEERSAAGEEARGGGDAGGGASPFIVGIGAAAGALKPLVKVLAGMPAGQGIAVVFIYHPETTKKNVVKLLRGRTKLEVVEAADGMTVLADRIHVMPPDRFLNITGGKLTFKTPVHCNGLLMPIDHFFCSLAADCRNRCCGVLLSGDGGDGTLGLSEIKSTGGRTIVQDPKDAEFPAMPKSAIAAGMAGEVLPAAAIAAAVAELAGKMIVAAQPGWEGLAEADAAGLRAILDILRTRVGHDFRCYKPTTLLRRIHRRMTLGRIDTMDAYARYLSENPGEVGLLQSDVLIGVTDFFRQPQAWETLGKRVIAQLIDQAGPGSVIRVWVPGCSSGKEVYSLAMLLTEEEQTGGKTEFQIFATDADYTALVKARAGSYAAEELGENVSAERLKRFFSRRDGRYQIIKSIRERVIFAAQNITADPPFSRLDLIICRNLLIYLDQEVQKKIIALFHFALREGGALFLGNAETIGDREDLFEPISKKWRIYRRIGVGHRVNVDIPSHPVAQMVPFKYPEMMPSRLSLTSMAQQVLLDRFAPACVMIDRKLQVLYVHGIIENYLTIPAGELTTRVVDMAREGLRARLRGAISKCIETGRPVSFTARTRRGEKSVAVKATVSSLRHVRETDGLLLITFEDQHLPAARTGGQKAADGDARQLADELKITREELQSSIDQLESSNDQLKASNEEVTAANEELQSANEEMETSKEELQSLNEELNTINVRLQEKVDELENANNDVVNLLASTSIATVFLDKKFKIKRFTPAITRLMSVIPSDIGRPLPDILMRFTDEALVDDARRVLGDLTPLAREVRAEDGRWYIRRIMPYRTQDDRIEGLVITFVDVAELKEAQEALAESRRRLAVIMDSIADGFFAIDREWRFTHVNDAALRHFGKTRDEMLGRKLLEVFPAAGGTAFETGYRQALESGEPVHFDAQSTIGDRMMEIHAYPGRENLTVFFRDVTARCRLEEDLRVAHDRAVWLARFPDENPAPVLRASMDGAILYCNQASVDNAEWACKEGDPVPDPILPHVAPAMVSGEVTHRELQLGEHCYAISLIPFPEESYVNIYGRDITARKQAEEEMRRSEERLKRAQEIAHLGSWDLDLVNDRLIWSDEVYRIFGLQPQEFGATYEAFLERVHPDDREAVDAAYAGSLRENRDTYEIEHRVIRKDTGEVRFVQERCQHFRSPSGKIVRSVGMIHEVTDRRRAEEKIVRQSDLLAAVNRILSAALHAGTEEELGKTCLAVVEEITSSGIGFIGEIGVDGSLHDIAISDPGWEACRMTDPAGHRRSPGNFKIHGIYGKVLKDGKGFFTNDPAAHPDRIGFPPGHPPLESFLGAPLLSGGKVIGMIAMGNRGGGYSRVELEALEVLGPAIVEAFQRKRAEENLLRLNAELEERVTAQTAEIRRQCEAVDSERQRLYDVLELLPSYVVLLTEDHRVPFANRYFRERFGESHGRRCYEYLFQRTEPCDICETYTVLKTGKPHRWDWTGPDGRNYDVHDFPFTATDGAPMILEMGIDVTEIKQAAEALRKANETLEQRVAARTAELVAARADAEEGKRLLESVMEVLPVGMAITDAKGGNIHANLAFDQVWGAPRPPADSVADYSVYKAWWAETGEPLRPEEWASAKAVLKGEPVRRQLLEIERFDGARAFVINSASPVRDGAGKIVGSAVALQDITDLRRAEDELRRSEQLQKLFIEHAPAALAMFDRHMRYLSASRHWREDFNLGDRDLTGVSHYAVLPEISAEWREEHCRALAGEVIRAEADRFDRADGSVQWLRREIRPWYDAAGAIGGIVIFTEDITEGKRAEENLERRSKLLEAANKELESFSYSVSHDLRAPLRAIDGYSRMILKRHGDRFDADIIDKFNIIRENAQMMGNLIDDLLAFSRLGRAHLSVAVLDMAALIREVWGDLEAANPDRRLILTIGDLPVGRGDLALIRQVLVNILSNAVKFSAIREEVKVEAEGYCTEDECVYSIRDNGIGFDMQYHDKLFGVFQRLHNHEEFEGTGVGLAIVERVIHRHGGRVWAEGKPGEGACFFFSLPR